MRRMLVSVALASTVLVAPPFETAAAAAPGDPIGSFDSVSIAGSNGSATPEENDQVVTHYLYGWAADQDTGGQAEIHVYLDGQITNPLVYSRHARPDVGAVHPWVGEGVGWQTAVTWPASSRVAHRICIYAINEGAGSNNPLLGCKTVAPGGTSPGDPRAHLDVTDTAPGLLRVVGWAGDPDSANDDQGRRMPTRVRVYYDGRAMTEVPAHRPRPDVGQVFPALGPSTGFDATLPITPGRHFVCLYALNQGRTGLQNTTAGCATVTVPSEPPADAGSPRGAFDGFRAEGGTGFGSTVHAHGWVHDPDGDPGVTVFTMNYADFGFWSNHHVHAPTDRPRPDVAAATGAPVDTGFDLILGGGKYFVQVRLACVIAGDVAPGGALSGRTRLIGCRASYSRDRPEP